MKIRLSLLLVASIVCVPSTSLRAQATSYYEQTHFRASHNWAFRNRYPEADRLFNAFDYGHAILSETLWRQPSAKTQTLDGKQFDFITKDLLVRPPKVLLDESAIAPEWAKLAPEVLMMFEWSHMLHRQIYDVWADERIKPADKDAAVAEVVRYYKTRGDLAFSSKPKDMMLMEGQPYSLAFRKRFPKFNGLIWSYHWLQMTLYEGLLAGATPADRKANVNAVVNRFREMTMKPAELPTMMPMSAGIAPLFTDRYTEASIIFDNLHSLHDVVSDILANPNVPRSGKRRAILTAAAHYRDNTTSITSIEDWRTMAREMGVQNMGGLAPIPGQKMKPDSASTHRHDE